MARKRIDRGIVFLLIGAVLLLVAAGWYVYNLQEDAAAGKQATELLEKMQAQMQEQTENTAPVIVVEGESFCGTVRIEKLGVELPVYDRWDYAKLKKAPCRYSGSVQTDDLIIAAHNYQNHFGQLKSLSVGDEVVFVDAYGVSHSYLVSELAVLDGTAVSDMQSGQWDFTLFTCTPGGAQRVTLRCNKNTGE